MEPFLLIGSPVLVSDPALRCTTAHVPADREKLQCFSRYQCPHFSTRSSLGFLSSALSSPIIYAVSFMTPPRFYCWPHLNIFCFVSMPLKTMPRTEPSLLVLGLTRIRWCHESRLSAVSIAAWHSTVHSRCLIPGI